MSDDAPPFELLGDATYELGSWFGSEKLDAPMVKHYRNTVKVFGNRRDWFLTPDTARSMASALNHFADRAEAFTRSQTPSSAAEAKGETNE